MRYILSFLVCFMVVSGFAQHRYQGGLLPAVNLSHSFASEWKVNMKVESRQQLFEGGTDRPSGFQYEHDLTDVALVLARKWRVNQSIAGGYMSRFRDGEVIHRFIQQYSIVNRYRNWRVGHRFSADQTFAGGESGTYRLRYRVTLQVPLQGESVDPGEFYIKINNEVLNEWQAEDYDLEIRLVPFLGYEINDNSKIELGIDYRLSSFLEGTLDQRYWGSMSWFLAL